MAERNRINTSNMVVALVVTVYIVLKTSHHTPKYKKLQYRIRKMKTFNDN